MSWLQRLIKKSDDGTTITIGAASLTLTAGSVTLTAGNLVLTAGNASIGGTLGVTGIATLNGVAIQSGATINVSPTPACIGDLYIAYTTGKLYIAGGISASTDWKLVTSA